MVIEFTLEPHDILSVCVAEREQQPVVTVHPAAAGATSLARAIDDAMATGYGECFWPAATGGQYWWIFKRDENKDKWARHGAAFYLTKDSAPMFLNTSNSESPEYRDGLAKFDRRLSDLAVEHIYRSDNDGRGHQISTDPKTLAAIYEFFVAKLK